MSSDKCAPRKLSNSYIPNKNCPGFGNQDNRARNRRCEMVEYDLLGAQDPVSQACSNIYLYNAGVRNRAKNARTVTRWGATS